jgi:uncharacterized protein YjeT (DUF2065 family)
MTVFMTAVGLVLVFEGVLYAAAPRMLKRMAALMQEMPEDALRMGGLAAVAAGVALVWMARGVLGGS